MNLARCTATDEILVAYITDMSIMQKKVMTEKKVIQIFRQEKCTPAEKILATSMDPDISWTLLKRKGRTCY